MAVNNSNIENLAGLIRRTRKASGLSQSELAELAGIGKTLVFDLEKGHENIQFAKLKKVMKVLNIKMNLTGPLLDFKK